VTITRDRIIKAIKNPTPSTEIYPSKKLADSILTEIRPETDALARVDALVAQWQQTPGREEAAAELLNAIARKDTTSE
jgi:hypothetical protein